MDHFSGCPVCGERLVYATEAAHRRWAVCGTGGMSEAACLAGHYVCDACHPLADCPFHPEVSAG